MVNWCLLIAACLVAGVGHALIYIALHVIRLFELWWSLDGGVGCHVRQSIVWLFLGIFSLVNPTSSLSYIPLQSNDQFKRHETPLPDTPLAWGIFHPPTNHSFQTASH